MQLTTKPNIIFIDWFFNQSKTIAAAGTWQETETDGRYRYKVPIAIGGTTTLSDLYIEAFSRSESLRFSIVLCYKLCIFRLDYWELDQHNNHKVGKHNMPEGITVGPIKGPHFHHWSDNRMLATNSSIPSTLEYARALPSNLKSFENCFRWFCGEANIELGGLIVPELPLKDRLI